MRFSSDICLLPFANPVRLAEDLAVSLKLQDRLLAETVVDRVETLKASHSAYFSQPEQLARTILKIADAA